MKFIKEPDITIDDGNGLGYWGYIKHVIANAGNGTGRASIAEYWSFFSFILGTMVISVGLVRVIDNWYQDLSASFPTVLIFVPVLVLVVPLISLSARRFHDIGWSGWWALTNLWPINISIPGQKFDNIYEAHPKSKMGAYSRVPSRTFFSSLREGMNSMAWLFP